jgi:SSS family solute:Na+ symporter
MKIRIIIPFLLMCGIISAQNPSMPYSLSWSELPSLPPVGGQPDAYGVAGPYAGIHNDALIIAGGSNFPEPRWDTSKEFHNAIWVLSKKGKDKYEWINGGILPFKAGYGACISTASGVLCMGGCDNQKVFSDVFLLSFDKTTKKVKYTSLTSLPAPCCNTYAAVIGKTVYIAGGQSGLDLSSAMTNFWRADISGLKNGVVDWELMPAWPGPPRAFNLVAAQKNGKSTCVYVFSGRHIPGKSKVENLQDVYEFNPDKYKQITQGKSTESPWRRMNDVPRCVMAGTAASVGSRFISVFGGADVDVNIPDSLKRIQPLFKKVTFVFDTYSNNWIQTGPSPMNHVTTIAVPWGKMIVIPSGEIKPRTRTPEILSATPTFRGKNRK